MSRGTDCRYVKLKEAAQLIAGSTPPRSNEKCYAPSGLPWAKIENLDQGEIVGTKEYLSDLGASMVRIMPKGSILISVIGTIGKIGMAGIGLAANQQIMAVVFRPDSQILQKYGYYYLKYSRPAIQKMAYSTVEKRISAGLLGEFVLPVPPLDRQRRIVALMEKIDRYVEQQEKKLALIREYAQQTACEKLMSPQLYRLDVCVGELQELTVQMLAQARLLEESCLHRFFDAWETDKNGRYRKQEEERLARKEREKAASQENFKRQEPEAFAQMGECDAPEASVRPGECGAPEASAASGECGLSASFRHRDGWRKLAGMWEELLARRAFDLLENLSDMAEQEAAEADLKAQPERYLNAQLQKACEDERENPKMLMDAAADRYLLKYGLEWLVKEWNDRNSRRD